MSSIYSPDLSKSSEIKKFKATVKEGKKLIVSVDPGYDAYKIIINGEYSFKCKSLALFDDTGDSLGAMEDNTIRVSLMTSGKYTDYIMGDAVENIISDPSDANKTLIAQLEDKETRFFNGSFTASYFGALYAALYGYAQSVNMANFTVDDLMEPGLNGFKIYQLITLPHEYLDKATAYLKDMLSAKTSGKVSYKNETFNFIAEFNPLTIRFASQAISAYYQTMFEPYGAKKDGEQERKQQLETLILDSGRKTMGQALIDKNNSVKTGREEIESKDFAMNDVDKKVVAEIKKTYGDRIDVDVNIMAIEAWANGIDKLQVKKISGRGYEVVDVKAIRDKYLVEMKNKLVDYIEEKFKITYVRSILVCGGTGSLLYDAIQAIYGNKEDYPLIDGNVHLLNAYLIGNDKPIGPDFAVSYGAYCFMSAYVIIGNL